MNQRLEDGMATVTINGVTKRVRGSVCLQGLSHFDSMAAFRRSGTSEAEYWQTRMALWPEGGENEYELVHFADGYPWVTTQAHPTKRTLIILPKDWEAGEIVDPMPLEIAAKVLEDDPFS